jgi:glycosyltransferase involved in cell wall biosynthesis
MTVSNKHIANDRIFATPPKVARLPIGTQRCKWSVMIPVFNCSKFLPATLQSVMRQAKGDDEMQIEVVDDDSTDANIETMVKEVTGGRVKYFRQPRNVGSLRNFLTCIERARGELVHILHGDDLVRPCFYLKLESVFDQCPTIGAAFSRYAYINEEGKFLSNHEEEMRATGILGEDWLEKICERQRIQYAAMVVKRNVYETLGGFYGVEYGEDWEMWARISAQFPVAYVPEVLAEYRRHPASISGRSALTGKNMEDLKFVMNTIQRYLPMEKREIVASRSRKFYAHYALRTASAIWKNHRHKEGAHAQLKAAWQMHQDFSVVCKILAIYTKTTLSI